MEDWRAMVAQYGPLVWKTAYRLLAHREDTADCFQDAFLCALEVTRRQEVRNWAGLLQRLATSRALDALRHRARRQNRSAGPAEVDVLPGLDPPPSEKAEAVELGERLRRALRLLPAAQAEAFCLRHLSEMSYDEIAGQMDQSIDAVGVLLYRARARLRELLMSTYGDDYHRR
jgi:RNA polymerase sigma factor (sigma-70 family)